MQFTLTVTPNYVIIFLVSFGGTAGIAAAVLVPRSHRRRREAKAQEIAAILATDERNHAIRRMALAAQVDIMGRPTDEPEVLESEEGEPDILR